MHTDTRNIVATSFDSWQAHDFATFRANLADDVVFNGPMGYGDDCTEAISASPGR